MTLSDLKQFLDKAVTLHMTNGETAKVRVRVVDEEYDDLIVDVLETSTPERYRDRSGRIHVRSLGHRVGGMTETAKRHLICRMSHVLVRSLASINLVAWTIDTLSPRYGHAVANGPESDFFVRWLLISSMALPVYAGIEALLMWSSESEWPALLIDAIFACTWAIFFWLRVAYEFTHRVLF